MPLLSLDGAATVSQRCPAVPAVVLLSSGFRPLSYSDEAIRVLSYPMDPNRASLHEDLEAKIKKLVPSRGTPESGTYLATFQSGRRQYEVRLSSLANFVESESHRPAFVLLLERSERRSVNMPKVAQDFRLTPREVVTLGLLFEGLTSKEIAHRMDISPHTVKAFLRIVMGKMHVTTRAGIIGVIIASYLS